MLDLIIEAYKLVKAKRAAKAETNEKAAIAQAFNNRYTYRKEWVEGMGRLPGTAMYGINPFGGFAWMCPECNKIHHPKESSVFSGLQYPQCCGTAEGNRLSHGIKI